MFFLAGGIRLPLEGGKDPDLAQVLEGSRSREPVVCKGILEVMRVPQDLSRFWVDYVGSALYLVVEEGFQILSL